MSVAKLVCCLLALLLATAFLRRLRRPSVVSRVPGPPSPSWFLGNLWQLVSPETYGTFEYDWQKKYGPLYRFKSALGQDRLMVGDPVALQFLTSEPTVIGLPSNRKVGKIVFGDRTFWVLEADEHRRARAALNPGFSGAVVRQLNLRPLFSDIASRIVQQWAKKCLASDSPVLINVVDLLDRGTLDVISQAALGLPLNTIESLDHPLTQSHLNVLEATFVRSKAGIVAEALIPYIPLSLLRAALHMNNAIRTFRRVTDEMVADVMKREHLGDSEETSGEEEASGVILDTLTKNLSSGKKRLSAAELAEHIRIILVAGQDTVSVTVAWALHELAKSPSLQRELREELIAARNAQAEIDYDALQLFNAFIKETLRLNPPAAYLERMAGEDIVVPLLYPIALTSGEVLTALPIKKGQSIWYAITSYNRLELIWGPDADVFRPARWLEEGNPCSGPNLGPYAQLFSFSSGNRICIGWRCAISEIQILLAEALLNFSFRISPNDPVKQFHAATVTPVTKDGHKGLNLLMERVLD